MDNQDQVRVWVSSHVLYSIAEPEEHIPSMIGGVRMMSKYQIKLGRRSIY